MSDATIIRGPVLNPRDGGRVEYIPDAALAGDGRGRIAFVGPWEQFVPQLGSDAHVDQSRGILCPPFLDAHIHVPQHPIRGHFLDGVEERPSDGRLIAGLNRNVFPAEGRFADLAYAEQVIRTFLDDTLAHGVIGGAAYCTVHRPAAERALEILPDTWSAGLVLMNSNCPEYLRNDERAIEQDLTELAEGFGRRFILTDRFAVSVTSELRRRAVRALKRFDLLAQTHLNEQVSEKRLVEEKLYPDAGSYANVYAGDGLLDRPAILAHCIHMRDEEFEIVRRHRAMIAHCPTSNTLLGSGIMPLDRVIGHGIDYAICTDVGASPTTSLLAEMAQFVKVHAGRSPRATPSEALYRATLAPAKMLGLDLRLGSFEPGKELSFVEIAAGTPGAAGSPDDVILSGLLRMTGRDLAEYESGPLHDRVGRLGSDHGIQLDALAGDVHRTARALDHQVLRVTLQGRVAWQRKATAFSPSLSHSDGRGSG